MLNIIFQGDNIYKTMHPTPKNQGKKEKH